MKTCGCRAGSDPGWRARSVTGLTWWTGCWCLGRPSADRLRVRWLSAGFARSLGLDCQGEGVWRSQCTALTCLTSSAYEGKQHQRRAILHLKALAQSASAVCNTESVQRSKRADFSPGEYVLPDKMSHVLPERLRSQLRSAGSVPGMPGVAIPGCSQLPLSLPACEREPLPVPLKSCPFQRGARAGSCDGRR